MPGRWTTWIRSGCSMASLSATSPVPSGELSSATRMLQARQRQGEEPLDQHRQVARLVVGRDDDGQARVPPRGGQLHGFDHSRTSSFCRQWSLERVASRTDRAQCRSPGRGAASAAAAGRRVEPARQRSSRSWRRRPGRSARRVATVGRAGFTPPAPGNPPPCETTGLSRISAGQAQWGRPRRGPGRSGRGARRPRAFQRPPPAPPPLFDAVLFDRDGTLVHDVPYNGDPARVRPVPGARAALDRLRAAGLRLGVVTNQSGLARGLFDPARPAPGSTPGSRSCSARSTPGRSARTPSRRPTRPACRCRKPAAGAGAGRRARAPAAPLPGPGAWWSATSARDMTAAAAAGAAGILVPTPVTRAEEVAAAPAVVGDLAGAVDLILRRQRLVGTARRPPGARRRRPRCVLVARPDSAGDVLVTGPGDPGGRGRRGPGGAALRPARPGGGRAAARGRRADRVAAAVDRPAARPRSTGRLLRPADRPAAPGRRRRGRPLHLVPPVGAAAGAAAADGRGAGGSRRSATTTRASLLDVRHRVPRRRPGARTRPVARRRRRLRAARRTTTRSCGCAPDRLAPAPAEAAGRARLRGGPPGLVGRRPGPARRSCAAGSSGRWPPPATGWWSPAVRASGN